MTNPAADITSFEAMRHAMVQSQLRTNAVNDPRVVTAMAVVAREKFVPEDVRTLAYRDNRGGDRQRSISQRTDRDGQVAD